MPAREKQGRGFTLVELLIALILLALLAGLAAPVFRDLVVDLRIHSAATGFERVIRHARQEAATRRSTVRICPSQDGVTCDGANWESGWISYVDRGGDPGRDPTDPLLRVRGPSRGLAIHTNAGTRISINPLGRISRNASVNFCSRGSPHPGFRLVMIHSGRLRLEIPAAACRAP